MANVKPTRLKDLSPEELYRSAIEDFALVVSPEESGIKDVLLAAFEEGGVDWPQYLEMHPELKPEKENRGGVITSPNQADPSTLTVESAPVAPEAPRPAVAEVVEPVVHVAQTPTFNPQDKFLVKMERDNPTYEIRGYRFTREKPYHLVNAADAGTILREDGFRQAYPDELEEFYK